MKWESTIYKPDGLYKIEETAFSIPRLKYKEIAVDEWIRNYAKTLPVVHRIDTPRGNNAFQVESEFPLSLIVHDYRTVFDLDYYDTLIFSDQHCKRELLDNEEVCYDFHINGEYYLVKYPKLIDEGYKIGKIALHKWYHDALNGASRRYAPSHNTQMFLDLPINESWLFPFCESLEKETFSTAIVDKIYADINANFFHLHNIVNVATGKSLFQRNFMQYTKHELYYDMDYQNLQNQDPFMAIGQYFKEGQLMYLNLPLLLLQ